MPESPIRKLAKYADAAKLAGVHVYHLNIGQPDIQTPPQALEAVKNFNQDILSYSPSQGLKSLRTKMVSQRDRIDGHAPIEHRVHRGKHRTV